MGGRAGGSGTGFGSRSGGIGRQVGPNIIDNPKAISTSDLIKMSESGGLASGLATKELNSRLEVVKANNMVFRNPDGKLAGGGYLLKVGDAGYVGFASGVFNTKTKKAMPFDIASIFIIVLRLGAGDQRFDKMIHRNRSMGVFLFKGGYQQGIA